MTDFLREFTKHYPGSFIIALMSCVLFLSLMFAVISPDSWFGQSWEIATDSEKFDKNVGSVAMFFLVSVLMSSTLIWGGLDEFNSSFEGLLVDKYDKIYLSSRFLFCYKRLFQIKQKWERI